MLNLQRSSVTTSRRSAASSGPVRVNARSLHRSSASARVFNRKASVRDATTTEIAGQGREWLETILTRFGPIRDRAETVTTLDFEKPLVELDKRIMEVRLFTTVAIEAG